jgi:uncharacterized protein
MNSIKKITALITILFLTFAFNSYSTDTYNATKTGWFTYIGSTLFNGYSALRQLVTETTTIGTGFSDLPIEMQATIIKLFAKSSKEKTLEEAGKTINALAQTSKYLNKLINDPEVNLELIKNRAKQFNASDAKVAIGLQTKTSKDQLKIQLVLAKIIKEIIEEQENDNVLPRLNKLLDGFKLEDKTYKVNLDFTYRWDKESQEYFSPLIQAVKHANKFLINYLLTNGANINQAGFNGKTPLMYADNPEIITFLLAKEPNLNIDQQDASGNTALLRAIQNYFPEDGENRDQNIAVIQTLLNDKANPTIANNNGDTPLQAAQDTGDQEVINILQEAIDKILI